MHSTGRCWRFTSTRKRLLNGARWKDVRGLMTIAIETSCDDTCVAVLDKQALPSGKISTQLLFNKKITNRNSGRGGIHPIEALESHEASLATLVSDAVKSLPYHESTTSGYSQQRVPDLISVTRGPGMRSNLACGLNTAKGLASAYQIPIIGVHHMQAHALTPRLEQALSIDSEIQPQFPFMTLLVSGGHTMLLHSRSLVDHEIVANTRDIAIGDALDKCGRTILPEDIKNKAVDTAFARYLSDFAFPDPESYKCWPIPQTRQEEIDKEDNMFGWRIRSALADTKDLAFSFTSLSSTVGRLFAARLEASGGVMSDAERMMFAQTALGVAFEHLIGRTVIALKAVEQSQQQISTLVVSGGVAANAFLRYYMRQFLDRRGFGHIQLFFPRPEFCTDNAAMIAWAGLEMFEAGYTSSLDISAVRKWSMDPNSHDGGILGAPGWIRR